MHRTCGICNKKVSNLSSHMSRVHNVNLKNYLKTTAHRPLDIDNYSKSINSKSSNTIPAMETVKINEYVNLLRQFVNLKLHDQRKFIRNRAPESFIKLLRECVVNIKNGNVPCGDESLLSNLRSKYGCQRIIDESVSNKEVRFHVSESKMIDILNKLLPLVIIHLFSFHI